MAPEEEPIISGSRPRGLEVTVASTPAAPAPKTNCERFAEGDGAGKMTCVNVLYGTNRTLSDDRPDVIESDRTDRKRNFYDQGDLFSIRPDSRENCEPNAVAWSQTATRMDVCHLGEPDFSWISHDQFRTALPGSLHLHRNNRMSLSRVGPDYKHQFRITNLIDCIRHCTRTKHRHQTGDRRSMSGGGTLMNIVGPIRGP